MKSKLNLTCFNFDPSKIRYTLIPRYRARPDNEVGPLMNISLLGQNVWPDDEVNSLSGRDFGPITRYLVIGLPRYWAKASARYRGTSVCTNLSINTTNFKHVDSMNTKYESHFILCDHFGTKYFVITLTER